MFARPLSSLSMTVPLCLLPLLAWFLLIEVQSVSSRVAARSVTTRSLLTLPELPYLKAGLAPAISPKTLEFHYGKHHQTYVNNANNLIKGTDLEDKSLEDIIHHASAEGKTGLFNNSAQIWNHSFFWECMSPEPSNPSDALSAAITEAFGSLDEFKTQFTNNAVGNFGSGWTWLVKNKADGKLAITNTSNAGTPLVDDTIIPLLTIDVWEHAYYLDWQNRRPDYVGKWWEVVNWKHVDSQLKSA